MADSFEFSFDGLEEFQRNLEKAIQKSPVQAEKTLKKLGRDFKSSAKKRAESELQHVDRKEEDKKKAIGERWGSKRVDDRLGMAVMVWNSAPHFHLIEDGHQLVQGGQVIGFVEGKHIMKKTQEEYADIVPKRFEKMVDDILKESDLN
ncbi:MAG: HK97 gp10 family phage protein [Lachnospiraceae bacterium]